jgi:hypothetical protein
MGPIGCKKWERSGERGMHRDHGNCFRRALLGGAMIGALSGCGSDAAGDEPAPIEDSGTGCSVPGDTYRVGLTKTSTSGKVTVELADANPAPPGYGTNRWSLKIADAAQAPVIGAKVNLGLRMPDHADHSLPGTVGIHSADGAYDVSELNLTMAGLYNITVEIVTATYTETVLFQFCVARKGN